MSNTCNTGSETDFGPQTDYKYQTLFLNRTQSSLVNAFLAGHNTLRRHLYLMGLINNSSCRRCGTEEETSVHVLCECKVLASLRHKDLGSFFLDPEDIKYQSLEAIRNSKRTGLP